MLCIHLCFWQGKECGLPSPLNDGELSCLGFPPHRDEEGNTQKMQRQTYKKHHYEERGVAIRLLIHPSNQLLMYAHTFACPKFVYKASEYSMIKTLQSIQKLQKREHNVFIVLFPNKLLNLLLLIWKYFTWKDVLRLKRNH